MTTQTFISPFGKLILVARNKDLVYCNWISPDCNHKYYKILKTYGNSISTIEERKVIQKALSQLEEYFSGVRKEFNFLIHLEDTIFRKRVWKELQKIPCGHRVTYSDIATSIGSPKACRAVAGACGANPLAIIIPCHRVIASSGNPGGYTGGIHRKISLLKHENIIL